MTHSRQTRQRSDPRRHAVTGSALAAGFLVVAVSAAVVFWSDLSGLADGIDEDDRGEVAVESFDPSPTSAATATPESASRYIEGDVGFPETLNPLLASSSSEQTVTSLLYRGLLFTDERGNPVPDLAVDWDVSADGRTYSLRLDPEARWHDGEAVSVDDVLFTVSLVKDGEFPGDRHLSRFWRAITATQGGEDTVEFRLIEPYEGFAYYLRLPILPRHHFGNVLPGDLDDIAVDQSTIGSGPYQLDAVNQDEGELAFSRVTEPDEPGLQEIAFRYYQSRDEAIEAFADGDVDGVSFVPLEVMNGDQSLPEDARVFGSQMASYTAMFLNLRHPHFRSTDTRRAIEHAIDRDQIVETVLAGQGIAGTSPIPPMSSAHDPGEHADYDQDEARRLLEADDWVLDGDDEVRQRDGEYFLVPLIVNSGDPQRVAAANTIQEQLGEVGISVDVQAISTTDVERALTTRQFTAVMFGWQSDNGSLDGYQMWHSSQGEEGSNFAGFVDPEVDRLLLEARQSTTIDERNQHYAGFQQIFAEQVPAVVLFYPRYHFAVSERVEGAAAEPLIRPADRVRQMSRWYME